MLLPVWFPFVEVAGSFRLIVYSLLFLVGYRERVRAGPTATGVCVEDSAYIFYDFFYRSFSFCVRHSSICQFFFLYIFYLHVANVPYIATPRGSQPSGWRSDNHAETAFLYIHTLPGLLPLFCLQITQELVYGGRDSANSFLHSPPRQRILLLQGREFAVGSGEGDREG